LKRIGIISDTHGVVDPRIAEVFHGVDHILHAGDIGGSEVIATLNGVAPVTSVEGNVDDGSGTSIVRATFGDLRVLLTHVLPRPGKPDRRVVASLREEAADFVIFGHSHLPHDETIDGVRFFNPASAGPRRFDYPRSVGMLEKKKGKWTAWHIALDERSIRALELKMNQLSD
jgi:putative phosphoesterase